MTPSTLDMPLSTSPTTSDTPPSPASGTRPKVGAAAWVGRVLTGIVALFLTFDAVIKIVNHPEVAKASAPLGIPEDVTTPIGWVLAFSLLLHLVPRTAVLGAILLTGYLGGAVFVHVRVHGSLFGTVLFPVYFGIVLWAGLCLRDPRARRLLFARDGGRPEGTDRAES
jgi:hypothetical protein